MFELLTLGPQGPIEQKAEQGEAEQAREDGETAGALGTDLKETEPGGQGTTPAS